MTSINLSIDKLLLKWSTYWVDWFMNFFADPDYYWIEEWYPSVTKVRHSNSAKSEVPNENKQYQTEPLETRIGIEYISGSLYSEENGSANSKKRIQKPASCQFLPGLIHVHIFILESLNIMANWLYLRQIVKNNACTSYYFTAYRQFISP
jgi:hypothetical protein